MSLLTTLRKPRIGPFAVFDFAASYALACALAPRLNMSRKRALYLVLPVAAVTHAVTNTKTPLNDMLTDREGGWAAKVLVAGSLAAALMTTD